MYRCMLLVIACLAYSVSSWTLHSSSRRSSRTSRSTLVTMNSQMPSRMPTRGGHGQGFKYLPMIKATSDEHYPRIIQIAGMFPDLSAEELMAPSSTPAAPKGSWTYDFSDPSGPQMGVVALPGSQVISDCIDPVVMITTNTALGLNKIDVEMEMMVVVDRGETYFSPDNFYVFKSPENRLVVEWCKELQSGYEILGKVVVCTVPFLQGSTPKSGFAEDGEDDG